MSGETSQDGLGGTKTHQNSHHYPQAHHSLAFCLCVFPSFLLRMHSWPTTPKIIVMKIPVPMPKGSSCC